MGAPERQKPATASRAGLGVSSRRRSVQLLGQLHAANALEVALDGGGLLALALGSGLLVELAGTQLSQQAQLLDGALEAAQGYVEWLVLFDANSGHVGP